MDPNIQSAIISAITSIAFGSLASSFVTQYLSTKEADKSLKLQKLDSLYGFCAAYLKVSRDMSRIISSPDYNHDTGEHLRVQYAKLSDERKSLCGEVYRIYDIYFPLLSERFTNLNNILDRERTSAIAARNNKAGSREAEFSTEAIEFSNQADNQFTLLIEDIKGQAEDIRFSWWKRLFLTDNSCGCGNCGRGACH